ncbi:hypothetical protein A3842_11145 [Paenibacillus sp. P3E]|uniref:hypothetical protein n=1 Tax=Paenibacillus sp. P3E TaxID=1349435 RepID=UPI00093BAB9E|nr:hypothetical protein [Paenibacillus sp. P3E]OKP81627.1 hypothetical protein A3842_11145 [Paenibacillus sp. P3E]
MNVTEIQGKIEQLQYELNTENQRGGLRDAAKVENLELQIADLNKQIEDHNRAAIEATVTTEVSKFMDTLDFEGVNPQDLFLNFSADGAESSYNYVNAVIQNAVSKMKQADLSKTNALIAENEALQAKCDKLQQEKEELSHDLSVQNLEVSDLNARLANATRMLDEEKAEVERLTSQVDDLRKEIAVGAAAAAKVVEVDVRSAREIWEEERQKEENAKEVIYNIRWKDDLRRDTYLAELAKTDETIEIPYYAMNGDLKNPTAMKGKYRVVTSEQAPSFRAEYLAKQNAEQVDTDSTGVLEVAEQLVTPTVPSFREEDSAISGLDQVNTGVEMAGKTVEERLQALELAVFGKAEVEAA